ncbi:MAG: hypothetical protein AB7S50_06095 [Bacteroidales bacterium]
MDYYKPVDLVWIKDIPLKGELINTDHLGNIYTVNNITLTRFSALQNTIQSYSNNLLGGIHSIDVTDPFRIIIFYKEFNTLVFLNSELAELRSAINLSDLGYYNVIAVGTAANGGFWIYEKELGQIIYIDNNLKTAHKSSILFDLIESSSQESCQIVEKNDFIYLGVAGQGIFQFDNYGTFMKNYPILDFLDFQVVGNNISFFNGIELTIYNTQTYESENIKMPVEKIKNVKIEGSKVFLLLDDRISIYSINN